MNLFLIIIFSSLLLPRGDCFNNHSNQYLERVSRPDRDTSFVSSSGYFRIWYDLNGSNAPSLSDENNNSIPDYVEEVGIIADSARKVITNENYLGYTPEPLDCEESIENDCNNFGGDSKYDIYLRGLSSGQYGYCYPEGGPSYLEIAKDYTNHAANSSFNISPIKLMQITLVHEYFHAIQYGYQHELMNNDDLYFYEMSSMWIEDVIIPDGNDYLDGWVDDLLEKPWGNFDDRKPPNGCATCVGKGYELALFGHYLSSFLDPDGISDSKKSTIIRKIWDDYSNLYGNYSILEIIDSKLKEELGVPFIDAWTDFISRNIYNGIDPSKYYYLDQDLISPIQTSSILIDDANIEFSMDLNNKSASIRSYRIEEQFEEVYIDHEHNNFTGNIAIITENNENNNLIKGENIFLNGSDLNTELHFIYGIEDQSSMSLGIELNSSIISSPSNLRAEIVSDSVKLFWDPPNIFSDDLTYIIYRNSDSIGISSNFFYIDYEAIPEYKYYSYQVCSMKNNVKSHMTNSVEIFRWPNNAELNESTFSIYPNPAQSNDNIYLIYFVDFYYKNLFLDIINLKGQTIASVSLKNNRGWNGFNLKKITKGKVSSGIYLVRLRMDRNKYLTKKITILK